MGMAAIGRWNKKAEKCRICEKHMGFIAGLRGLGLRQKSHEMRCRMRVGKHDKVESEPELCQQKLEEVAATINSPQYEAINSPQHEAEVQFHLKPSVGAWLVA